LRKKNTPVIVSERSISCEKSVVQKKEHFRLEVSCVLDEGDETDEADEVDEANEANEANECDGLMVFCCLQCLSDDDLTDT
jgi:hypothetical protein